MLKRKSQVHDDAFAEVRKTLGALKIAAPLVRATILRPGIDAHDRDVGKTLGVLALRNKELASQVWRRLQAKKALGDHPANLFRLAQQTAYHVATHWTQQSSLSLGDMGALIELAADHVNNTLTDETIAEQGYQRGISGDTENTLAWMRASTTLLMAIVNGTSMLGHTQDKLHEEMFAHLRQEVSDWVRAFGADSKEARIIEQSLLSMSSRLYASLWLREIDKVKESVREMSQDELTAMRNKPYPLGNFYAGAHRAIGQLRDAGKIVSNIMENEVIEAKNE